jgi:putative acetyltransferase
MRLRTPEIPNIRRYTPGEESALFEVYYTAIHLIASRDYTAEQIQAWAPRDLDPTLWEDRVRGINPFVAELNGELVGYADLQPSGYIDHFFVAGKYGRRGIGSLLMRRLLEEAGLVGAVELTSNVSRTAQAFFLKFGFIVMEQRFPEIRGVVVPNALMRRRQLQALQSLEPSLVIGHG